MPILVLVPMVIGAAIGLVARYLLPGRQWVGLFLNPAASAAAAGIVWTILGLAGLRSDNGWLWIASLAAALVVALVLPRVLPQRRARADAAYLSELTRRA
jgi:quaternary ammonium compound-resistance protein SugE